jgi:DNA-directed RNA polymerase specialized sigma24 family protein
VTWLSIDRLRSGERTRPSPWDHGCPNQCQPNQESTQQASSLTTALLVLLEQLTPTERAVFLLREA